MSHSCEEGPLTTPHTWRSSPVATAHSRTVLSTEPEASDVPSGEKATLLTLPVWPSSTWGADSPGVKGRRRGRVRVGGGKGETLRP